MHLTGNYPEWWNGYRYHEPVNVWVASMSREATRDILQKKYYLGDDSSGMIGLIPQNIILSKSYGGGVSHFIDTVYIKHTSGGTSTLSFKSFDQGLEKFQGTQRHIIHLDEEPSRELYIECMMRTTATEKDFYGMILLSMVPLKGTTDMVLHFTDNDRIAGVPKDGRCFVGGTWDEVTHLTDDVKKDLISSMLPHEIEARTKGIPVVGTGKVFTMAEVDFLIAPKEIPNHWGLVYGVDPAATSPGVWGVVLLAHDRDEDIVYVIKDYKMSNLSLSAHAKNIKGMLPFGYHNTITGLIDPAGAGENQETKVQTTYALRVDHDLLLSKANKVNNAKEITINKIRERIHKGKFKMFYSVEKGLKKGCYNLLEEWRMYSRDEEGVIFKKNDHCLDALFYALRGLNMAVSTEELRWSKHQTRQVGNLY
ncbi:unnamed protein product [Sphagnum jensenii]|uniref:Terminase large subunit gp17-like C-terminal domain-containing protein n=1 Tax=Sphagnum jensenii TaxID=128206 RepID=A0ABP0VAH5_9BRYO